MRNRLDWNSQCSRKILHARKCPDTLGPRLQVDNIGGEDLNGHILPDSLRREGGIVGVYLSKNGVLSLSPWFPPPPHWPPTVLFVVDAAMEGDFDVHELLAQISSQSMDAGCSKMAENKWWIMLLLQGSQPVLQVRYFLLLGIPALSLLRIVQGFALCLLLVCAMHNTRTRWRYVMSCHVKSCPGCDTACCCDHYCSP